MQIQLDDQITKVINEELIKFSESLIEEQVSKFREELFKEHLKIITNITAKVMENFYTHNDELTIKIPLYNKR